MTIEIPVWSIPAFLSVLVFLSAAFLPKGKPTGSFDFGPAFVGLLQWVSAVIISLIVWLIFFIFY